MDPIVFTLVCLLVLTAYELVVRPLLVDEDRRND
jgi:hypothetical protein